MSVDCWPDVFIIGDEESHNTFLNEVSMPIPQIFQTLLIRIISWNRQSQESNLTLVSWNGWIFTSLSRTTRPNKWSQSIDWNVEDMLKFVFYSESSYITNSFFPSKTLLYCAFDTARRNPFHPLFTLCQYFLLDEQNMSVLFHRVHSSYILVLLLTNNLHGF